MKKVVYFLFAAVFAVTISACTKTDEDKKDDGKETPAPTADFDYSVDGLKVTFTNKSTNATSYKWDFGDDETSKEASPEHTYAVPGTYTVKLTAANADGATASKEAQVTTAAGAPKAYFTFEAQTDRAGKFGLTVNFDATASENASSISWDFGDGSEGSTEFKPAHIFPDYKTYTVKATVKNSTGEENSYSADVEVIAYNELLKGGGMEEYDAQYWIVESTEVLASADYSTTVPGLLSWEPTFGYTEDGPAAGEGGCLLLSSKNQIHDQANNVIVYQAIEVEEGDYLELSALMKWTAPFNDCGLLRFTIAPSLDDIRGDAYAIVEMFNYWEPNWDNMGGNSVPSIDGGFEANEAYIADNAARELGYSNAGESVAHYWAQATGTVYFCIDLRSVWGTCYGPGHDIFFDNVSVKVVPAPEE